MNKQTLYITSKFFFPNIGGVENSLRELASALACDFNVIIYTTNINNVSNEELPLHEINNNYKVIRLNCKHRNKYIQEILFLLKTVHSLRKENRECCIISRDHFSVIYAWLAGFRNIRYLVPGVVKYQNNSANHGYGKNSLLSKIENLIQRFSFKVARKVFVFSNNMKKQILSISPNTLSKLHICKPGVNESKFYKPSIEEKNALREKYGIPKDTFLVLGLARFVRAKGYANLLLAFSHLSDRYQLILVGDGPEKNTYNTILAENKITNAHVLGVTSKSHEFYKLSDLFAMTSIYEPLGQTILESQATGIPNLYHQPTDKIITAADEVIFKDYSFLIKENTPKSISEAIIAAKNGISEHKSERMITYINDNYSWYKLGVQLIND